MKGNRILAIVLAVFLFVATASTVLAADEDPMMGLFGGTVCLVWGMIFLLNILILIWVYKDAKRRGENAVLWLIIVLFTGIIGLIIWLVVRPPIPQQPYYQQPPPQQPPYQPPPQPQQPPQNDPYRKE